MIIGTYADTAPTRGSIRANLLLFTVSIRLILKDMRTSSLSNLTRKQIAFHLIVAAALWLAWAPGTILGAQDAAAPTLESCFGVGKPVQ